jgi:CSLREA domain-containing protein
MKSSSKILLTAILVLGWVLSSCGGGGGGGGGGPILMVNSSNDVYDGACNAAHCSLREAIIQANSLPEAAKIRFNIAPGGMQTIQVTGNLPTLTHPMTIDGTTQPGYAGEPLIVLDGSMIGDPYADGLLLVAGNTTIIGLTIGNFPGAGIHIAQVGGNVIKGCYIGTDGAGSVARPNANGGIWVQSGDENIIGTGSDNAGNLISGNEGDGITILSNNNQVLHNLIGTDHSGSVALGNSGHGVLVGGNENLIGGTGINFGNLISANLGDGVVINGVRNDTQGNHIGTNAAGTAALGNVNNGVTINEDLNLVGGTDTHAGNTISGNGANGVQVLAGAVLVQGNYIGTDVSGTIALGNQLSGVYAFGMGSIQIGGGGANEPGAMNVISANSLFGIYVEDGSNEVSVFGNRIGTDKAGTIALGNIKGGVRLAGTGHEVGASFEGGRNLISGNGGPGIAITSGSTGIVIRGNYIGTDYSGTAAIGNGTGIEVGLGGGDTSVTIGGTTSGQGNLISGNDGDGLLLYRGATVQGNRIGLSTTEVQLGNGGNGILIKGSGNTIDGTGMANTIANNALNGVAVISESGGAIGNSILSNSIYDNDRLGIAIDEDAVIPNDSQDLDTGDNNRQNYPVIISAIIDPVANNTTYHGTLSSAPGTVYTVEIYSDAFCDPSGYGEGRAMAHSFTLTTNVNGQASFSEVVPVTYYEAGDVITATATDPDGNTSEFSNCVPVTDLGAPTDTPTAGFFFTPSMNAYCRFGPDPIFGWDELAMMGQAYLVDGRNLENTWLYIMLRPQMGCWVPMGAGTPSGDTSQVRVLTAIPTPTFTPTPFNCGQYTNYRTCELYTQCKWNRTVTPNACQNK